MRSKDKRYSQVLKDSGKRPDVVVTSTKSDTMILAELPVSWEDRMEESNALKCEKYTDLTGFEDSSQSN